MKPSEIQHEIFLMLKKDEFLAKAGIACSCQDDGNFKADKKKAMGVGGSGIHAVVSAPTFTPSSQAAKNAVGSLRLKIAVSEVPNLNRKRPGAVSAADAAWHVAWILNQTFPAGNPGPMLVLDGEIAPAVNSSGDTVTYSVPFTCMHQLN